MPGKAQASGVDLVGLLYLLCIFAVLFIPMLLGRSGPPPGPPDPGSDKGSGEGPPDPPTRPNGPRGGLPLPDAEPARARLRDHARLADRLPDRERRPAQEPDRVPVRSVLTGQGRVSQTPPL